MDIRMRILRRIVDIGVSEEHHFRYECTYCPATQRGLISIAVFDNKSNLCDNYDKHGLDEETEVFEWLDGWGRVIREEQKYAADRH